MSSLPRIACMTMVKDDVEFLDIWVRYYSGLFGAENCYVIDHASSNRTAIDAAQNIGVQIVRIPFDYPAATPDGLKPDGKYINFDMVRFNFIGKLRTALKIYYDIVIFHDVDEVLFVRPDRCPDLRTYMTQSFPNIGRQGTVGAVGIEILHDSKLEAPFDPSQNVLEQRQNAQFRVSMCKPIISCSAATVNAHAASEPFGIDPDLCLLHLKFLDRDILLKRQEHRFDMAQRAEVRNDAKSRWIWTVDTTSEKLDESLAAPLVLYEGRFDAFLLQNYTFGEYSYYLADRRKDDRQRLFSATAGLSSQAVQSIQAVRFVLPESFKATGI